MQLAKHQRLLFIFALVVIERKKTVSCFVDSPFFILEVRFQMKKVINLSSLHIPRNMFFSFCVSKQDGVVLDKESVLCVSKRDFIRAATAAAAAAERKNKIRPV